MKYIEGPLQILNMAYPHEKLTNNPDLTEDIVKYCYGKPGLSRVMEGSSKKKNLRYTKSVLDNFGRIFSSVGDDESPLKKYSSKMYSIIQKIKKSEGIVIIYSNYIDGGCVPMALALEEAGITVNKNMIPFDLKSPMITSGIRIGTPAITTRGMKEEEMKLIAQLIDRVLKNPKDESNLKEVKFEVENICQSYPLYSGIEK